MKERPGVMLYFENRECVDALPDEDAGKLMKAILSYAQTGENPQFEGVLNLVWLLLRPIIDRDGERYHTLSIQRAYASYCREQEKNGAAKIPYEEFRSSKSSDDVFRYPTTTTTPTTTTSTSTAATTAPTADVPTSVFTSTDRINHLGAHGKVLLTNKDYFELMNEYGAPALSDLMWKAETLAEQRGYDTDTMDWPNFLRHCRNKGIV